MPRKREWAAAEDELIRRLRLVDGRTWDQIAAALGINRTGVVNRADALGIATGTIKRPANDDKPVREIREPLHAGHPTSWAPLAAAISCEGTPYPAWAGRPIR